MRKTKSFKNVLLLGIIFTVLIPLFVYLYAFYDYQKQTTHLAPFNSPEFIGEGLIPIAVTSFLAASFTVIIVRFFINIREKQVPWVKLTLLFSITFLVIWGIIFMCGYYFLVCLT